MKLKLEIEGGDPPKPLKHSSTWEGKDIVWAHGEGIDLILTANDLLDRLPKNEKLEFVIVIRPMKKKP